jgi:hypothetical protein
MEIVGLKNVVQDDVNKLIAKFVGVQSKPAQILQNVFNCFEHFDCCYYLRSRTDEIYERRHTYAMNEYDKLMLIKSIPSRRRKFELLPQWIKKLLIIWRRKLLFPLDTPANILFLQQQIDQINFKCLTS